MGTLARHVIPRMLAGSGRRWAGGLCSSILLLCTGVGATAVGAQTVLPTQARCGFTNDLLRSTGVNTDGESYVFVAAGRAYEVLKGQQAQQYLADKRLRHPERFTGMGSAVAARGYRPTETVVVLRSLGPAGTADFPNRSGPMSVDPRQVATTFTNAQGELTFWSWDDGDNATWEGSQYAERYSDHAWATYGGQLDISTATTSAIWGTRTGGGVVAPDIKAAAPGGTPGLAVFAPFRSDMKAVPRFAFQLDQDFKDWAICIISGCLGCAGGCIFTGPLYPECYGA